MLRIVNILVLCCLAGAVSSDVTGRLHVIDGDTFRIGQTKIRLFGVDAPEADQTCADTGGQNWRCGAWVTQQVRTQYQGRRATCQEITQDRYGRTVASCQVSGKDLGKQLVLDGLAFAFRRYSMDYDLDEKAAFVDKRGIHAWTVMRPSEYRKSKVSVAASNPTECAIKGNISSSGRIFHEPGQYDYARTRINTAKGERWFCSAQEARAAGWRRARR